MKLLYQSIREGVRACVMALDVAGLPIKAIQKPLPVVTLQLDEKDHTGNFLEIAGELSICRYIMEQSPTPHKDNLETAEWLLYELKPVVEAGKAEFKTHVGLHRALDTLEGMLGAAFLGGESPNAADLLAFCYIVPLFAGNAWLAKKYPVITNWYKELLPIYTRAAVALGDVQDLSSKKTVKKDVYYESKVKLQRDKSTTILPDPARRNILITSALPYVNNVPHLGNIIGCVLSADVYARYCRLMGFNTLFVCGTDEYGTATETKAIQEGLTPQQICDKYYAIHRDVYQWFDIDTDIFGRTSTSQQTQIAQEIFMRLHANGELFDQDVEQTYCQHCQRFLADRYVIGTCPHCGYDKARGDQCDGCQKLLNTTELINSVCFICGNGTSVKSSKHIFLNLPSIKDRLESWLQASSVKGQWSQNAISTAQGWIRDGLKGRCITRDLKWGTPVPLPEFADKVFYVWFDAPIGYISITANYTDQWAKWWKNPDQVQLYQFMGKDNIPFHTVIFPSTLLGTQDPWTLLHHISTTEYLTYEGGKFSKSMGRGVFGDNAMATGIPVEVFRYYLLCNRPEISDTDFQWSDFGSKNNNELVKNLGNLCNRFLKLLEKRGGQVPTSGAMTPADTDFLTLSHQSVRRYVEELGAVNIKAGLKTAMELSAMANNYLQEQQLWTMKAEEQKDRSNAVIFVAANVLKLVGLLMEPYMPSFSAKLYEQMGLPSTESNGVLRTVAEGDATVILTLVPAGVSIGTPQPIFKTRTS